MSDGAPSAGAAQPMPSAIGAVAGGALDAPGASVVGQEYICGFCGARMSVKAQDCIRCRECGHRILYKARTKNLTEVEAR